MFSVFIFMYILIFFIIKSVLVEDIELGFKNINERVSFKRFFFSTFSYISFIERNINHVFSWQIG